MKEPRILSIQSSVVVGHVGNKSAVFPLQLLGYEVDVLNTVQFSNHTGYGKFAGMRMDANHLRTVFQAMDDNGLVRHSHLLTGYTPGAEALQVVSEIADRLKQANPDLIYVLDTVCGDNGKLYVSPEVIPIYKSLIQKATVITPNQFEAELFSDVKITSLASLRQALSAFHSTYRLPHALISSLTLPRDALEGYDLPADAQDVLVCAGSSCDFEKQQQTAFVVIFPEYKERFEGVGDVFSALVLPHFNASAPHPLSPLAATAETALASLGSIIRATREHAYSTLPTNERIELVPALDESEQDRVKRARHMELRLVQSQAAIRHPDIQYRAQAL